MLKEFNFDLYLKTSLLLPQQLSPRVVWVFPILLQKEVVDQLERALELLTSDFFQ